MLYKLIHLRLQYVYSSSNVIHNALTKHNPINVIVQVHINDHAIHYVMLSLTHTNYN